MYLLQSDSYLIVHSLALSIVAKPRQSKSRPDLALGLVLFVSHPTIKWYLTTRLLMSTLSGKSLSFTTPCLGPSAAAYNITKIAVTKVMSRCLEGLQLD